MRFYLSVIVARSFFCVGAYRNAISASSRVRITLHVLIARPQFPVLTENEWGLHSMATSRTVKRNDGVRNAAVDWTIHSFDHHSAAWAAGSSLMADVHRSLSDAVTRYGVASTKSYIISFLSRSLDFEDSLQERSSTPYLEPNLLR